MTLKREENTQKDITTLYSEYLKECERLNYTPFSSGWFQARVRRGSVGSCVFWESHKRINIDQIKRRHEYSFTRDDRTYAKSVCGYDNKRSRKEFPYNIVLFYKVYFMRRGKK